MKLSYINFVKYEHSAEEHKTMGILEIASGCSRVILYITATAYRYMISAHLRNCP